MRNDSGTGNSRFVFYRETEMKYHDIQKVSLVDGEGIRTVLWVSGCDHYCKGCQNPITWNPDDGLEFDDEAEKELLNYVNRSYIDGLTLSGGDPMYPANRETITRIAKKVKEETGKSIWMYTGYLLRDIIYEPVLKYLDVIVDGEFKEELADVNYMWAGSTNQTVWRKNRGMWRSGITMKRADF